MTNPIGCPTDYRPEFCAKVVKLMRRGCSIEELAYELEVSKQTIYNWKAKYPEFFDAITLGTDFAEGKWQKIGRTNLKTKEFNNAMYQMQMRNRFGWDKNLQNHSHNVTVTESDKIMRQTKDAYNDDNK
jgi:orotate phosphoribosyltransferase-like protein